MRQIVKFEPNQPVTLSLDYPDGVNVQGQFGPQVKFSISDNRTLYADPELAQAIKTLGVEPGQPFTITRRREAGRKPWWELARVKTAGAAIGSVENRPTPSTPAPTPKIEPTPVSASIPALVPGDVKRIPPQITREAPPPHGGLHLTKHPPLKPSYEEAFRECLRIVTSGLDQTGEQWSDGAKQAMVSTLMIQLGRENRLGAFHPQQAAKVA